MAPISALTSMGALSHMIVGANYYGVYTEGLVVRPRGKEVVSIQGNLLEAYGASDLIRVDVGGALVLSNNRCLLTSPNRPLANVTASAMIASSNYLRGPTDAVTLKASVADKTFTALGNITSGPIMVNNTPLSNTPWEKLNVLGG